MQIEDQGRGVLFSHMVIAEEYLKLNKKTVNDENLYEVIMKLAHEKADSYTPSDELGRNPESRISGAVKKDMAPWLYGPNSVVNKMNLDKTEKEHFMIEINGAINHLTQILLKRIYGFKTTRSSGAKLSDPSQLTDFEYLASGPDGMNKEERDKHNTRVDVNRQIRGMIQGYLTAAIIPVVNDNRNNIYKRFQEMYKEASPSLIKSVSVYKNLMKHLARKYFINFSSTKISDYVKEYKIKGKLK